MTELPKFLLGDNVDYPEDIFIIHTDYPRFVINLKDDHITWLEDFENEDQNVLEQEMEYLLGEATKFYDREIENYSKDA